MFWRIMAVASLPTSISVAIPSKSFFLYFIPFQSLSFQFSCTSEFSRTRLASDIIHGVWANVIWVLHTSLIDNCIYFPGFCWDDWLDTQFEYLISLADSSSHILGLLSTACYLIRQRSFQIIDLFLLSIFFSLYFSPLAFCYKQHREAISHYWHFA